MFCSLVSGVRDRKKERVRDTRETERKGYRISRRRVSSVNACILLLLSNGRVCMCVVAVVDAVSNDRDIDRPTVVIMIRQNCRFESVSSKILPHAVQLLGKDRPHHDLCLRIGSNILFFQEGK